MKSVLVTLGILTIFLMSLVTPTSAQTYPNTWVITFYRAHTLLGHQRVATKALP